MKKRTALHFLVKKSALCWIMGVLLINSSYAATKSLFISYRQVKTPKQLTVETSIQRNIILLNSRLYYPLSVARFYKCNSFDLAWIAPDTIKMHAYDAMLLLDCILQYGLSHADYHPDLLLYDDLNALTKQFNKSDEDQKARFDILLTDAMLRFINDLHYGKLNRQHTAKLNDANNKNPFQAVSILTSACKDQNFISVIESVQPKSAEYIALKHWMYLVKGVYTGDCYETPESTVRQVAINMERLRWVGDDEASYIHINIPSYSLKYHQSNKDYIYRVVVGKKATPTSQFQSQVTSIGVVSAPVKSPVQQIPDEMQLEKENGVLLNMPSTEIYDFKGNLLDPTPANIRLSQQNPAKYLIKKTFSYSPEQTRIFFRFYPFITTNVISSTQNSGKVRQRMITQGDIHVEKAERLVYNILRQNESGLGLSLFKKVNKAKENHNFRLKKAIPIHVTYLTCAVKDGLLETYPDIYFLDNPLAKAFYSVKAKK